MGQDEVDMPWRFLGFCRRYLEADGPPALWLRMFRYWGIRKRGKRGRYATQQQHTQHEIDPDSHFTSLGYHHFFSSFSAPFFPKGQAFMQIPQMGDPIDGKAANSFVSFSEHREK